MEFNWKAVTCENICDEEKVLNLNSKELVEFSQHQMFVLHLPPHVLDSMNGAAEVQGRGRREVGKPLMPCQGYIDQRVEEDTLDCH